MATRVCVHVWTCGCDGCGGSGGVGGAWCGGVGGECAETWAYLGTHQCAYVENGGKRAVTPLLKLQGDLPCRDPRGSLAQDEKQRRQLAPSLVEGEGAVLAWVGTCKEYMGLRRWLWG